MTTPRKRSPRFRLQVPIEGHFGERPVVIHNIGERGIQLEHREKLGVGVIDQLRFSLPTSPRMIRATARVMWCRVAKQNDPLAPWPYRCGLRLEGVAMVSLETLATLLELSLVAPVKTVSPPPDMRSQSPLLPRAAWTPNPPISLDESVAIIQSARTEVSRFTPEIRAALAQAGRAATSDPRYDDETLAISEYLGGALEPKVVKMVCELYET